MEQGRSQVWLADYSSDSDESQCSPIPIMNDNDFFHIDEQDQVLVSSFFESRQVHDDQPSCASRQKEDAHEQAASKAAGKTNFSAVAQPYPPASPEKRSRLSEEQVQASDSQNNQQTACAPHQREDNAAPKDGFSVANIASSHLPTKRAKYALEEDQLSPVMSSLLRQVKAFFVKPASLERVTTPVAQTTILKALERVRCEYILFYCILVFSF